MINDLIAQAVGGFLEKKRKPVPYEVSIDVPKDHPGLPRLFKAAKQLPDLRLIKESGVELHMKGLAVPGVFEEFFDALACVVGQDMVDEIQERLAVKKRLELATPQELETLLTDMATELPLIPLLKGLGKG